MWIVTTNGLAVNLDLASQVNIGSNGYGQFSLNIVDSKGSSMTIDNFKNEEEAVESLYNLMKMISDGVKVADIRKVRNPNANTNINLPLRGLV